MNTTVLDLAHLPQYATTPRKRLIARFRPTMLLIVAMIVATLLVIAASLAATGWSSRVSAPQAVVPLDAAGSVEQLNVDDKAQIMAEGLAAQQANDAIPLSVLPKEAARRFSMIASKPETYATALKCLTQAVYYEAAVEPLQGRRGVAQVVLNRVAHPAYPNNVCGVVYQGSERVTGCQFSFTCDGSLLRAPMARPWKEADAVARAALAGYVETSVGTATHYHADYVLPKWAFNLAKIEKLGRHIFYRFNGSWGKTGFLNARYIGLERIPALDLAALRQRALMEGEALAVEEELAPGLTVTPHVSDRHAENDVGGRLDMTKEWRLTIPDPVTASSRYRQALGEDAPKTAPAAAAQDEIAVAAKLASGEKPDPKGAQ